MKPDPRLRTAPGNSAKTGKAQLPWQTHRVGYRQEPNRESEGRRRAEEGTLTPKTPPHPQKDPIITGFGVILTAGC